VIIEGHHLSYIGIMSNEELVKGNMKITYDNGEWYEGEIYKSQF
jgi:hypothetical protein